MTVDPFAPAASSATNSSDPFLDPSRGGSYPKPAELLHKLLVMVPVEVEKVASKQDPAKMVDRWRIDTTVIEEDGSFETYTEMFWSHKKIAEAAKKAFREKRPMLGTLHLVPSQGTEKKFPTEAQLLEDPAIKFWLERKSGNSPMSVAWVLEPATPEQRKLALEWWSTNMNPFGG